MSAPNRMVVAPQEPTDDMFIDGMEASCVGRPSVDDATYVRSIWNAMLAAYDAGDVAADALNWIDTVFAELSGLDVPDDDANLNAALSALAKARALLRPQSTPTPP